jgi:hypothetical protein
MAGARIVCRAASSDTTLIAGRRLGDCPGQAFRGVSGGVPAVFAGSVFFGIMDTALNEAVSSTSRGALPASAVRQ